MQTASTETGLTEEELRELYDNEEIDRFLRLFSAVSGRFNSVLFQHVTEVYIDEVPSYDQAQSTAVLASTGQNLQQEVFHEYDPDSFDSARHHAPLRTKDVSLVVQAVRDWLVSNLPPPRPPPQEFTLGGLRLTVERLIVAVEPVYLPFVASMARLATWKDKKSSTFYCTVYWILWYNNILLPALLIRILYILLERKIFQHPTVAELQDHRLQLTRAAEIGDALSDRFSASSFGAKEVWRLFKVVNKTTKQKIKSTSKARAPSVEPESTTALDVAREDRDTEELKRFGLHLLHQIADFHERVKKHVRRNQ
ncbi:hypothetical protein H0H87_000148 [Tephrocybe sp. NHM501043]|nr:hypothetical protein H0H87_000148 [Tephrocybe sp. NHM501043]